MRHKNATQVFLYVANNPPILTTKESFINIMSNPNEPQNYGKEIHNTTGDRLDVTKTTETVNGANTYKDGFVNGQVAQSYQEDPLVARDNENAGRGLLIGILLASLAAITAGAVWFANQSNDVNTFTPVVVPVPNRVEPSPSPEIRTETKIIEKTKEVLVPIPQQQASPAPKPSAAPAQNINITVPPATQPSPAAKQVPATETAPPKSDTSSSSNTQTTTTTETAPIKSDTPSSSDMQSTTTTENSTTTTENSTDPATDGSN